MALVIQTYIMNNPFSFPFAKLFQGPGLPTSEPVTHSEWKHLYSTAQLLSTPDSAAVTQPTWHFLLPPFNVSMGTWSLPPQGFPET